ncbi:hypothetical protein DMB68_05325 [Flavobacterium hydrophilum]|uniref:Uncharacterized protein n=1 Tax=Flavobacterium hydrophilum TaxID=2211445 RepID=A0A2V4C5I0_9FLAO|nr:hypothetical protein DMB68_05325 [Flavobacterium hydrophilum]
MFFPLLIILNKSFISPIEYENNDFVKFILNNEFLKNLSYAFVITGSGIGAAKYLGNLHYFKNQIDNVLSSDKFQNILFEKISEANFSPEYLSNLSNIDKKWKALTLCKYQKKFPELMPKIEPLLENELFKDNNLVCYYNNFRILIEIELLENNIVKIIEKNFFYVKPTSNEKVPLTFSISSIPDDLNEKTYTKLDEENTKIDNVSLKELKAKDNDCLKEIIDNTVGNNNQNYTLNLEGKDIYYIERVIEMRQDLSIDRLSSFSSSKIIDHLNIEIKTCKKTDIFFSGAEKNQFKKDNFKNNKNHYIKDSPSLPGDIYNIFIFKKDERI